MSALHILCLLAQDRLRKQVIHICTHLTITFSQFNSHSFDELVLYRFGRVPVRPQLEVSQEGSSWRSIRHDGVAGPSPRSQFHPGKRAVVTGQSSAFNSGSSRFGRLTAVQKPNGGVRGIVAGDIVSRIEARTMSQQLMSEVQHATAPFQYALATKSGCESIAHALHGLTELNPRTTVTSIDGISAYDLTSRQAMLDGMQVICGKMQLARFTPFHRAKVENMATQ